MFQESFFKQFTQDDYSSIGPPCPAMRINRTDGAQYIKSSHFTKGPRCQELNNTCLTEH